MILLSFFLIYLSSAFFILTNIKDTTNEPLLLLHGNKRLMIGGEVARILVTLAAFVPILNTVLIVRIAWALCQAKCISLWAQE